MYCVLCRSYVTVCSTVIIEAFYSVYIVFYIVPMQRRILRHQLKDSYGVQRINIHCYTVFYDKLFFTLFLCNILYGATWIFTVFTVFNGLEYPIIRRYLKDFYGVYGVLRKNGAK